MDHHNPILLPDTDPKWVKEILYREIACGERAPLGYGYAWQAWDRDAVYVVPIPFNLLVQLARWLYYSTVHQCVMNEMDKVENAAYDRGREAGIETGKALLKAQYQMKLDRDVQAAYRKGWTDCGSAMLEELDRQRDAKRQDS